MFGLRRGVVSAVGLVLSISCVGGGGDDGRQTQSLSNTGQLSAIEGTAIGGCDANAIETVNRFIPHISTVPATQGEQVSLFLHERVAADPSCRTQGVVLFIHGGSIPSAVAYDVSYQNYSWMKALAAEGFDSFSLDHSGYGLSPRPMMDDPCNTNPAQQDILIPNPLSEPCSASYPFQLAPFKATGTKLIRPSITSEPCAA